MIRVKLTVRNPRNLKLKADANFLVDTGALFPAITQVLCERLRIKPFIKTDFYFADRRKVVELMAYVYFEFADERILAMTAISKTGECLLSLDFLAALGIQIDTSEETLLRALKKRMSKLCVEGSMKDGVS